MNAPPPGKGFLTNPHHRAGQDDNCPTNDRKGHNWNRMSHYFFPLRFSCPLNSPNEDRYKFKSAKASIFEACSNFHETPMNIGGKSIID